jgi:hypothetical protein
MILLQIGRNGLAHHKVPKSAEWANTNRAVRSTAWGGIGVLMKAYATDKVSKTCYLVMGHESETYIGALILENVVFCQHLCSVFQENVGRTLSEIGSLDLAYTL